MGSDNTYNWEMTGPPEGYNPEAQAAYDAWAGNSGGGGGGGGGGGNNAAAVVEQMYQDILGRAPDPGGMQAFTDAINNGADIGALAQSMAQSQEAQNRIQSGQATAGSIAQAAAEAGQPNYVAQAASNQVNEDYVRALYQTVLGRAPDAGGLADNLALLRNGSITPEGLANAFAASPEAKVNNIPGSVEAQMAKYVAQSYGQTGSRNINTATGDWSGVTPGQLINAGITNSAILAAAANGTLNDNIFGAYKVDANKVADALNAGKAVPTDVTQSLNSQTTNAYTPNGKITNIKPIGNGQSVYYYSDGATATINANGVVDHITPPAAVYRQQEGSIARTDNPGMAYFNGQLVKVETPALNWDPSKNKVAQDQSGQVTSYDPGPQSGGFIGGALANFDKGVRDTIPGGWYTVGAVALAAATYGASLSATSTAAASMETAGFLAAGGAGAEAATANLVMNYGMSLSAAEAMVSAAATTGAASTGMSAAATGILGQMGLSPAVTNALVTIGQGSLTGAGMGGITAAITGGDIGKGILNGAITGAVTGGTNMGLSSLGPIGSAAAAGVAGGATNAALSGGSIINGALTGGATGAMGGYLAGGDYAKYMNYGAGATGGIISSMLNGTNLAYGALTGAALGGVAGMVSSGVSKLTDPLIQQAMIGAPVLQEDGTYLQKFDDGSTIRRTADGKPLNAFGSDGKMYTPENPLGPADPSRTQLYTPQSDAINMRTNLLEQYPNLTANQIESTLFQNLEATGVDPFIALDISRLASQGLSLDAIEQVLQYSYTSDELYNFGLKSLTEEDTVADQTNLGNLTAAQISGMVSAGILTPKVLAKLSSKPQTPPPPIQQQAIAPVTFGNGQQLNFGGMNPNFLKPYDWNGFGTHEALPMFDPNAFTRMYMEQPKQAAWSQGAAPQTAQYVPTPFVPKTAYEYNPQKIFGPSGQPGGLPLPAPVVNPTATPSGLVSNQIPQPVPAAIPVVPGNPVIPTEPIVPVTP